MSDDIKKAQKYLEDFTSTQLNIAVTGESGSGKSTFVNAIRGMKNSDDGAAPTGVVETTTEPVPYPHPLNPNVTLWDLPGIGTTKFQADKYLEDVKFETYDFFIIVSADRFRENDAKLAQEIKKMGKRFYFVRSKMDHNLQDEKISQREYDEENTLLKIRENCKKGLADLGVEDRHVFLLSSVDLHLYDFAAVHETLERELPTHKREVLTLALPNISPGIITKKKEVFSSQIKHHALLAAAETAGPNTGLCFEVRLNILEGVLQTYLKAYGLDVNFCKMNLNISWDDLKAVFLSVTEVLMKIAKFLKKMLATVVDYAEMTLRKQRSIPGSAVACRDDEEH